MKPVPHPVSRRAQRGIASLVVTLLLCLTMVLAIAFAHRDIAAEERRSANDYRSAQAFEAAEAGLEWALARVDDPTRLDADCRPSADPAALSWRERMLKITAPSGVVVPNVWSDAGVATPLQSACIRDASGWHCSCPSRGAAALPAVEGPATAPAFTVRLDAGPRPGLVRVVASGCTRLDAASACIADGEVDQVASARHSAVWAWVPAVRSVPAAALTVRGDVVAGAALLAVSNVDRATGGLALHAGGRIDALSLRVVAPDGSSLGASVVGGDAELAALAAGRFFARHFGMDEDAWSRQAAVTRIACTTDCAALIAAAVAAGRRLIHIDGDLVLEGPLQLGTDTEPVALVASGAIRLSGAVVIRGALHGASLDWNDAPAGSGAVRGATVVAGDYRGDGAPDFVHDEHLLALLKTREGGFVRINGSWKDF
jgi:type IV pilus assembly PilX-like protein